MKFLSAQLTKVNCTVILDHTDYYEKLLLLLKYETIYKAIKQDQTTSIERRLNAFIFDLLKRDRITKQQYYFLRSSDSCAPRLYGLPKVHKKRFSHETNCFLLIHHYT